MATSKPPSSDWEVATADYVIATCITSWRCPTQLNVPVGEDPWTHSSTLLKQCRFTVNQTPPHGQAQNPRHRQHVPNEDWTDYHATHRGLDGELNHLYIQSTHNAWSKGNHTTSHFLCNTHHHCLCQWGFGLDWLRYHWWSSGRRHHGVVLMSHSSTMFRMVTGKPSMCSSRWLSKLYFTVVTPVSRSRRLVFCTHKCGLVIPVNWLDLVTSSQFIKQLNNLTKLSLYLQVTPSITNQSIPLHISAATGSTTATPGFPFFHALMESRLLSVSFWGYGIPTCGRDVNGVGW